MDNLETLPPSHPTSDDVPPSWWNPGGGTFAPLFQRDSTFSIITPYLIFGVISFLSWNLYRLVTYLTSEQFLNDIDSYQSVAGWALLLDRQARRQRRFRGWSKFPWVFIWPSRNYVLPFPEDSSEEEVTRIRGQVESYRLLITTSNMFMITVRGYAFILKYLWEDVVDEFGDWVEFRRRLKALRTVSVEEQENSVEPDSPVGYQNSKFLFFSIF